MARKICTFVLLFIVVIRVNSQIDYEQIKSKHQADLEIFDSQPHIHYESLQYNITPINRAAKSTPTITVFGYFPYWKYPQSMAYLQYDLLSHIALFDFNLSASGSISNPPNWPWIDLINTAHQNGVKVVPCIVNFSGSELHTILNDEKVQQTVFANILSIIEQYALDGVNIDFEGVYQADRGSILNDFMLALTNYLHSYNPNYEVSFAGPAVNWGGWELDGLANSCDYIFIMGYNFWGGWSSTSGPCAPLIGGAYNLTNTMTEQYGSIANSMPEKLILGVPYYGNKWVTDGPSSYDDVIDHINQPTYESAMDQADQDGVLWDEWSETSWSLYSTNDYFRQTWFDTDSSTGLKYDLAEQHNFKGVGMWALGYDGDRTELWDELRQRYGEPISTPEIITQPDYLKVYPNPTQENSTIEFYLLDDSIVILRITDNTGRIIPSFLKKYKLQAGNQKIQLDLSSIPAGVYYCNIKTSGRSKSFSYWKTMIIY